MPLLGGSPAAAAHFSGDRDAFPRLAALLNLCPQLASTPAVSHLRNFPAAMSPLVPDGGCRKESVRQRQFLASQCSGLRGISVDVMCSPARARAQDAVKGQWPLALSLRTNSVCESLPGSPQSPLTQRGIRLPGSSRSEVALLFGKAQMPCATSPPSGVSLFCCSELDL